MMLVCLVYLVFLVSLVFVAALAAPDFLDSPLALCLKP